MLGERLKQHQAACWLVNTGWSGGRFGVGKRMSLKHTRALVNAALDGKLDEPVEFVTEPAFGLQHPGQLPRRPTEILNPRETSGRTRKPTTARPPTWPAASKPTSSSSTPPKPSAPRGRESDKQMYASDQMHG
jgi:hypothetical protein